MATKVKATKQNQQTVTLKGGMLVTPNLKTTLLDDPVRIQNIDVERAEARHRPIRAGA